MKTPLRIIFLLGSALLVSFLLSSCGGNASTAPTPMPTPTPKATSSTFAYLQNNDPKGQSPVVDAIAHARSSAQLSHFRAYQRAPRVRTHNALPQASNAVNIAAGTVDAYVMDAGTGGISKLNSQSGEYNGIQLSPDGTEVVFTAYDNAGYSQIFLARLGNFDNPTQLTSNQTEDHFDATFSPDGNTITSSIFNPTAPGL